MLRDSTRFPEADASSVAEKIQAPLYKMDVRQTDDESYEDKVTNDFKLAAKWNAVLLIDECDTYLHARSDSDLNRNSIISSTFLCFIRFQNLYSAIFHIIAARLFPLSRD